MNTGAMHYGAHASSMMPGPPPPMPVLPQPIPHENIDLSIPQQPERAKVVSPGRERDRKPIDPPPIVRIEIAHDHNPAGCSALNNPYIFCSVSLWHEDEDKPKLEPESQDGGEATTQTPPEKPSLRGSLVSSLHRLKDLSNKDGGFFVFGDVSAGIAGSVRLKFTVWEFVPQSREVRQLKSILSDRFEVGSAREWDGIKESTPLSRSFADQGVKLRLRKESRAATQKRNFATYSGSHTHIAPQIQQSASMPHQMHASVNTLPRPHNLYADNSMMTARPMYADGPLSLPPVQASSMGPPYNSSMSHASHEPEIKRPRSNANNAPAPSFGGLHTPPGSAPYMYSNTAYQQHPSYPPNYPRYQWP